MEIYSMFTAIFPLAFILIVTAIKDAYEDIRRHITDYKTNSKPVRAIRLGKSTSFSTMKTSDVSVGDFIFMRKCVNRY